MAFDAYDYNFARCSGGEMPGYGGNPHAEGFFVDVFDGGFEEGGEFVAGWARRAAFWVVA